MSDRLAEVLRAEGGLLAQALRADPAVEDADVARVAASGPRSAGHADEVALLVEAIHEAYLLHYGVSATVSQADRDLALLAGDRLYALGLDRLARLGDLESVDVLAEVIARCAEAHAAGDPGAAAAAWHAGAEAVGWGRRDPGRSR
jgi:geranylgeranyl pyrophosphate synthase